MSEVKYFHLRSYGELINLLGQLPEGFQTVAGTTDFTPQACRGVPYPTAILDISKVSELREIKEEDNRISVGSAVTMADLVSSKLTIEKCPVLASAAESSCGRAQSGSTTPI